MITKAQALDIAKVQYGAKEKNEYSVFEFADTDYAIYNVIDPQKLWCVTVVDPGKFILESTTIVLIHKETGEVFFHGMAADEG